jgi:hypothetical protein
MSHSLLQFSDFFDCVVMLTASDWHTEMRSNRFHYATRFARHLPVLFVQPDLPNARFYFENTDDENIVILHVYSGYGSVQSRLLNRALNNRNYIKPLLWIYNYFLVDFVTRRFSPLKIYHATEDYFSSDFRGVVGLEKLKRILAQIDLLVAVSDGVKESYVQKGRYLGQQIVIPNGCDFKFWALDPEEMRELLSRRSDYKKVVFYQGNINYRLDFDLIDKVIIGMADREFWFCGDVDPRCDEWKPLLRKHKNLKYLGKLAPEEVRGLACESSVGIMPFVQNDLIVERSLPLKAFEYVACGLPVVTVPIRSLKPFCEVFRFAETSDEFIDGIRSVEPSRFDAAALEKRLEVAREQDYDNRFHVLHGSISRVITSRYPNQSQLKILILYDDKSTRVRTILEHLESFSLYSRHQIWYAVATHNAKWEGDLSTFDVIIINHSIRVNLGRHLSPHYAEALRSFGGFKILFIQDEYDTTEVARNWIKQLGIHLVYTCIPEKYIELIYPKGRFPYVEFVPTLTGYVETRFESPRALSPISERKIVLGYRGRPLPYWYGSLGQEKIIVGRRMKEICEARGITVDISWEEEKRIYGEGWYGFLENCKAMLGTESGSNVFDEYGEIMKNISEELERDSSITYDEIYAKYLKEHEGRIVMNQISPKIFEAIVHKTALVLFEGSYSGIIKPDVHYIPLRKDFSNVDDVLRKLKDDRYLEKLTNRAYGDIIESGQYSYSKFIQDFEDFIGERVIRGNDVGVLSGVIGSLDETKRNLYVDIFKFRKRKLMRSIPTDTLLPDGETVPISTVVSGKVRIAEKLSKYPLLFRSCRASYRIVRTLSDRSCGMLKWVLRPLSRKVFERK